VPFHHAGRIRGGIDCAGLIIVVAKALGIESLPDRPEYSTYSNIGPRRRDYASYRQGIIMEQECDRYMDEVDEPELGGVGLFEFLKDRPQHVGFFGDHPFAGLSLIHTYMDLGKVTEHAYADEWPGQLVKSYRLKGVER
jgi:hypothetical protein